MAGCVAVSTPEYVLVCIDRTRTSDILVFWRANGKGYTTDFEQAGLYTQEEAIKRTDCGQHLMFLAKDLSESPALRTVVDRDMAGFKNKIREMNGRRG